MPSFRRFWRQQKGFKPICILCTFIILYFYAVSHPSDLHQNSSFRTAGATPLAFGDFSYYWIADREGRSFKRLNELYATTGQVGFLASQRVDGKLILSDCSLSVGNHILFTGNGSDVCPYRMDCHPLPCFKPICILCTFIILYFYAVSHPSGESWNLLCCDLFI